MKTHQIVLTEKCNLDCHYCYIDQKDNVMTKEVFLDHFKTFDEDYKIDLFGGEPLMNWELIKFITTSCLVSSKARCMEINLYSNGLLLDQDKVNFIRTNGINFFWSYDGLWADYEVDIFFVNQLTDRVSVQVGPPNLNIVENYEYFIKKEFLPTFTIIKDNIWSKKDIETFKVEFRNLCNRYKSYLDKGKNYIPGMIKHTLSKLYEGLTYKKPYPTCGAGDKMNCYMPDGSVYPCARFGTYDFIPESKELYKECESCYMNYYCNKGCYFEVYMNNGPIKNICEVYEIVMNEVIELNKKLKGNQIWKNMIQEMMKK